MIRCFLFPSLQFAPLTGSRASAEIPANLASEGMPELPPALVEDAARYLEFRTAAMMSWHPQQVEMLIATRFADTPQFQLVRQPGGERHQLTFGREPVESASFHPVTGDCLIYSHDTGVSEFYQLYRYDPAEGRGTLLTDEECRNTGALTSKDGRRFAWTYTRRIGKDNDVLVMDPHKFARAKLLAELTGGGWGVPDWSQDGTKLVLTKFPSANLSHLWLLDAVTGQRQRLPPAAQLAAQTARKRFGGGARPDGTGGVANLTTTSGTFIVDGEGDFSQN